MSYFLSYALEKKKKAVMNAPLLSQHGPKPHSLSVLHVQVILYELPANLQSIFYQ